MNSYLIIQYEWITQPSSWSDILDSGARDFNSDKAYCYTC